MASARSETRSSRDSRSMATVEELRRLGDKSKWDYKLAAALVNNSVWQAATPSHL